MPADEALPRHAEAVREQHNGEPHDRSKDQKYDHVDVFYPLEVEREPGKDTHGDKVNAYDKHRERIVEELMGEMETDIERLSPEKRSEHENVCRQEDPKFDQIQACAHAFE
jgi:hypothetical protein